MAEYGVVLAVITLSWSWRSALSGAIASALDKVRGLPVSRTVKQTDSKEFIVKQVQRKANRTSWSRVSRVSMPRRSPTTR